MSKPFIIKTPYPTSEEVAKKLGVSKSKLEEIKKRTRDLVNSKWFQDIYSDKSLGDSIKIES
jgi:DNA-directed RNA polymerase sigma subunit (sigma70/sigma32)